MQEALQKLHESPGDGGMRFVSGGYYSAPKGRDYPPHFHTSWELVYYLSGNALCPVGDRVYKGVPGTLLATPPRVIHAENARTAYANLFFSVEAPADYPWPVCCTDDADRSIEETCRALLREAILPDSRERERMLGALLTRLDILLRRAATTQMSPLSSAEKLVGEAERILEERFAEQEFRIAQLAQMVGASVSVLRAAFAQARGYSPREARATVRVRHATDLLRTSNLTLDAIAHRCGYDNASHLSRHIIKEAGVSPGRLRSRLVPGKE